MSYGQQLSNHTVPEQARTRCLKEVCQTLNVP